MARIGKSINAPENELLAYKAWIPEEIQTRHGAPQVRVK
jgi:hypothetical protein